jgi:hypothetical protein
MHLDSDYITTSRNYIITGSTTKQKSREDVLNCRPVHIACPYEFTAGVKGPR